MIAGDLNARTGESMDFITNDTNYCLPIDNYIPDKQIMHRKSQDKECKGRGNELLNLCISAKLRILNGRVFGDSQGKFTCHTYAGSSVVDYVLANEAFLNNFMYLTVKDWQPFISDHCPISFSITTPKIKHTQKTHSTFNKLSKGFPKTREFLVSFEETANTDEYTQELNNLLLIHSSGSNNDIENLAENLTSIITHIADTANKNHKSTNKNSNNESNANLKENKFIKLNHRGPKWENRDMKDLKREVLKLGNLLTKNPGDQILRRNYYYTLSKYRKTNKRLKRDYKNKLLRQIYNIDSNDTKDYWDAIKELRDFQNPKLKLDESIPLDKWYEYFNTLNQSKTDKEKENKMKTELEREEKNPIFNELSFKIKTKEIRQVINKLKNGKAAGLDRLTSEMFKILTPKIVPILCKLFNFMLTNSYYPNNWATGYIITIFKKNDHTKPENYRGIAINNCISKIFNTILNNRLMKFVHKHKIISKFQGGFMKKCGTTDHIFTLKTIIDKYIKDGKHLYACYIDFHKAFDTVWHTGLMYKLRQNNIGGPFYKIIKNMYEKTILSVKNKQQFISDWFSVEQGIRQGDTLSPLLFNIFVNEIPELLLKENCASPTLLNSKVPCLLYADDIVLLSETKEGLQNAINNVKKYCDTWELAINPNKSKVMIFNKSGKFIKHEFKAGPIPLECVNCYTYLGLDITPSGSFSNAKKIHCMQKH
jgi:hypothetical protein